MSADAENEWSEMLFIGFSDAQYRFTWDCKWTHFPSSLVTFPKLNDLGEMRNVFKVNFIIFFIWFSFIYLMLNSRQNDFLRHLIEQKHWKTLANKIDSFLCKQKVIYCEILQTKQIRSETKQHKAQQPRFSQFYRLEIIQVFKLLFDVLKTEKWYVFVSIFDFHSVFLFTPLSLNEKAINGFTLDLLKISSVLDSHKLIVSLAKESKLIRLYKKMWSKTIFVVVFALCYCIFIKVIQWCHVCLLPSRTFDFFLSRSFAFQFASR